MNKFQQYCRKEAKKQIQEYWNRQLSYVNQGYSSLVDDHTNVVYVLTKHYDDYQLAKQVFSNIEDAYYKKVKETILTMLEEGYEYYQTHYSVDVVSFVGK